MYISYDYYRIFYYVAKYRSFTKAAHVLLNSQPNITRAVKNLESGLGCSLFFRTKKHVSLTPEGEKLFAHIQVAFDHIQAGEEELSQENQLQRGLVSIGASETALHCLLLPVLKEYRRCYPGISIKVSNHSTPQAIKALKNGLVDLAVVTTPLEEAKNLKQRVIKEIREVAVCGQAYAFLAEKQVSLEEIHRYPIVSLGRQTKTYEFYSQFFSKHGLMLSPDIEAATADQILPMVKNDLGIGFVPELFVRNEADQKGLYVLDLAEEIPKRSVCMLKRTDLTLSIAAKKLENMILDQKEPDDISASFMASF